MTRPFQPSEERFEISVAVCACNRVQPLNQALSSILSQNTRGRRFEVIVVDDGSTDGTSKVVEQLQRETAVTIEQVRCGIGPSGYLCCTGFVPEITYSGTCQPAPTVASVA